MRIDAHQHFWNYDPQRDTWIDDSMVVLKRDFMPDELRQEMVVNEMNGCVAVQADQSEVETQFLLDLANENPFIKGVVGWVDLRSEAVTERLEHFSVHPKFKGVRHIVQAEPDPYFLLHSDFKNGIASLSRFGLTYDLLIFPKQLKAAIELAKQFPNQPFIVDHLAKPLIKHQLLFSWKESIQELAQLPNVYCKVSGMITEANWHSWKMDEIRPYIDVVFNAFGTDRVMFGSDWPVCKLAGSYTTTCVLMEEYLSSFSIEDKSRFWGENAIRFYNLDF